MIGNSAPSAATIRSRGPLKNTAPNPDRSWRAAGRKLCWSPAAPPASGYESPSRWPKMKRSVTMVNALSSTLFSLIGPVSNEPVTVCFAAKPIPCLLPPSQSSAVAPRLLYAQSSVEFHAQLSVLTQIRDSAWCQLKGANPADIGSISFCKVWDSVAPLAQLLSSESAVSRAELCEDAAFQADS